MSRAEALAPPFGAPPAPAPLVSVVIPTYRRPEMVREAVRSALAQTLREIEVIVVVDGAEDGYGGDGETVRALAEIGDPRLGVVRPGRHLGNAGARNAGVAAAEGRWIALLDDDDVWMPDKLARQMAVAEAARVRYPVVSCRFVARGDAFEAVWPRRLPRRGQAVGDYLMCRHRPATGDGVVQTSTVLAPAALFRRCPFDEACGRFVDVDWLLRAAALDGFELVFAGHRPAALGLAHRRPPAHFAPGRLARGRGLDAGAPPPREPTRLWRLHADAALDPRRARARPARPAEPAARGLPRRTPWLGRDGLPPRQLRPSRPALRRRLARLSGR